MDIVPAQDNLKIHPVDQSGTCFGKAPTSQNPIELEKKHVYEVPKQNGNEHTMQNGNETPKTTGNEYQRKNTMPFTSFESGNKSIAEKKSCCSETSWGTPFSSNYIHPLFMGAGKTSSSVVVSGHSLNYQGEDVSDKETSTVMFTTNKMVDNANDTGQVNESVLKPWGTPMTNGHSVHSTNQTGMAIAALSSCFVPKNNIQNIWGAQNIQSLNNNTNVTTNSWCTAFSKGQNASMSWGTPRSKEMTKPSAVMMERSNSACHNDPHNPTDSEMENVSNIGVDVLPIEVSMDDNNNEHNRKRKATTDTETNNTSGNLTASQQRRNELARCSCFGYDIPNATWRPLPI